MKPTAYSINKGGGQQIYPLPYIVSTNNSFPFPSFLFYFPCVHFYILQAGYIQIKLTIILCIFPVYRLVFVYFIQKYHSC